MKTRPYFLLILIIFLSATARRAHAQEGGNVDFGFTDATANGPSFSVATTSGGYIWMGGYFNSVNNSAHTSENNVYLTDTYFDLAVLNTNGTLDTSFTFPSYSSTFSTYAGGSLYNYYVSSVVVDPNDVVFAAFNAIRGGDSFILRFDPSGPGNWTLNTGFTGNTQNKFAVIYSMAVDGSTLYVAGSYSYQGYTTELAELNYSGVANSGYSLPPSLAASYYNGVYQVTYLPMSAGYTNNSLLICGSPGVARISPTGTDVYADFPVASERPTCAATRPDSQQLACPMPGGEYLAGGASCPYSPDPGIDENSSIVDGFFLSRYGATSTNNLFSNISGGYDFSLSGLDALPDGDMVICGDFNFVNGRYVNNFAHLLADGTVDTTFGNSASLVPFSMVKQPDGKYVLGGGGYYTEPVFGGEYGYVVRYYGVPPSGVSFTTQPFPTNQTVYVGDTVYISAQVSSSPGLAAQWLHNGTNLPDQTSTDLYFTTTCTNDSGCYALVAQNLSPCPQSATSSNAYLTVLAMPAPPPNDMFADAYLLTGTSVTTNGVVRGSTLESGEPDPTGQDDGHSVWYSWTAPETGNVTIDVSGSDFTAAVGVYAGSSVNNLSVVADNCIQGGGEDVATPSEIGYCNGLSGTLSFFATNGMTYQIGIGGTPASGSLGDILLVLTESLTPVTNSSWAVVASNLDLSLYYAAAGGGQIAACGYPSNEVVSAPDTVDWTTNFIAPWTSPYIDSMSYANGLFFVGGQEQITTSPDTTNWITTSLSNVFFPTNELEYVYGTCYANGLYVTAVSQGIIITSPDAVNWTQQTTNAGYYSGDWLYDVAYGNGTFVAVGDDGSVVTSTDGTNWSLAAAEIGINIKYDDSLYQVAFGNGVFVAVGDEGTIVTSPDGTNWSLEEFAPAEATGYLPSIAFGNGRFVTVGAGGFIGLSTDGTNWVQDSAGTTQDLNAVTYYKNGQFAIAADNEILINQPAAFQPVTSSNGNLVLTLVGLDGASATVEATTSLDPTNWQPVFTSVFTNGTITFSVNPTNAAEFFRAVTH